MPKFRKQSDNGKYFQPILDPDKVTKINQEIINLSREKNVLWVRRTAFVSEWREKGADIKRMTMKMNEIEHKINELFMRVK